MAELNEVTTLFHSIPGFENCHRHNVIDCLEVEKIILAIRFRMTRKLSTLSEPLWTMLKTVTTAKIVPAFSRWRIECFGDGNGLVRKTAGVHNNTNCLSMTGKRLCIRFPWHAEFFLRLWKQLVIWEINCVTCAAILWAIKLSPSRTKKI